MKHETQSISRLQQNVDARLELEAAYIGLLLDAFKKAAEGGVHAEVVWRSDSQLRVRVHVLPIIHALLLDDPQQKSTMLVDGCPYCEGQVLTRRPDPPTLHRCNASLTPGPTQHLTSLAHSLRSQAHERSCLGRRHNARARIRDEPLIVQAQEAQRALDSGGGTDAELQVALARAKLQHAGLPVRPWPPPTPPLYNQPQGTYTVSTLITSIVTSLLRSH